MKIAKLSLLSIGMISNTNATHFTNEDVTQSNTMTTIPAIEQNKMEVNPPIPIPKNIKNNAKHFIDTNKDIFQYGIMKFLPLDDISRLASTNKALKEIVKKMILENSRFFLGQDLKTVVNNILLSPYPLLTPQQEQAIKQNQDTTLIQKFIKNHKKSSLYSPHTMYEMLKDDFQSIPFNVFLRHAFYGQTDITFDMDDNKISSLMCALDNQLPNLQCLNDLIEYVFKGDSSIGNKYTLEWKDIKNPNITDDQRVMHYSVNKNNLGQSDLEYFAEFGVAHACMKVGKILETFKTTNYEEQKAYFEKAAEYGIHEAEYGLAHIKKIEDISKYLIGKNKDEIAEWFIIEYRNKKTQYGLDIPDAAKISEKLKWIRRAANHGNKEAQYELSMHEDATIEEYEKWLEPSALQGSKDAQYELGKRYKSFHEGQAMKWFEKAAQKGHKGAQYELGLMKMKIGKLYEAKKFFKQSITHLYIPAYYGLAEVYEAQGDFNKAIKYYEEAFDSGYPEAEYKLGRLYKKEGLLIDVEKWFAKSIEKNPFDTFFIYELGMIYKERGDLVNAIEQFKKAIGDKNEFFVKSSEFLTDEDEDEDDFSESSINNPAFFPFYTEKNQPLVLKINESIERTNKILADFKNSDLACPAAYYELAKIENDQNKKFEYFKKAADLGHIESQYELALIYLVQNNFSDATRYFEPAAYQCHPGAQYYFGFMFYMQGLGINKGGLRVLNNLKTPQELSEFLEQKGLEWLKKAADQGHLEAKKALDQFDQKN